MKWPGRKTEKRRQTVKTPCQRIESSIIKKFRKEIWRPFVRGMQEYEMVEEGDRVAVCISGGKDSMLLAKCMQEIQRHGDISFELRFLVMDPGYHPDNRKMIEDNARKMEIPIEVMESDIFDTVVDIDDSPCYLCARMRRGFLYANAKAMGCNKIALGHHFNDVVETILMGMIYGGQFNTMMPKLFSTNFEGMELIRPLYYVKEEDILGWKEYNELQFLQCACRFTEQIAREKAAAGILENPADIVHTSKRQEIKELIRKLKEKNPSADSNIFKSAENVNLDICLGYVSKGIRHHFMDSYGGDDRGCS